MVLFKCDILVFLTLIIGVTKCALQPNIVLIIGDDMGWNDVGFHGSNQIPTPNIDALAYNGVILNSHYVLPICTPSRAALMTGKYPIHTGMQGYPLRAMEPRAVPPGKLLPGYLKDLGYDTSLVGKWHLGHSRWNETPTERGFDTHIGYYSGFVSYYDFLYQEAYNGTTYTGFDMRRNKKTAWEDAGQYATDFFTNEAVKLINNQDKNRPMFMVLSHLAGHTGNGPKFLEAPQDTINKLNYVVDAGRRTYAAMISKLDDSVGQVVTALKKRRMLDNTIIVFMSDNGAPSVGMYQNYGSNYPLRGVKETLWEGGVRGAAFVWSPLIQETPRVSNDLFHISDWLPTLVTAAGGDINNIDPDCDGIDQWSSLVYNFPTPRSEILLNIDEKYRTAAIRYNNWKLVIGSIPDHPEYDGYFGESGKKNLRKVPYNTTQIAQSPAAIAIEGTGIIITPESEYKSLREQATLLCLTDNQDKLTSACKPEIPGTNCLYDISSDPCEEHDLSQLFPYVVRRLKKSLVDYRAGLIPQKNAPSDPAAIADNFGYVWTPWLDSSSSASRPKSQNSTCPMGTCDM
ncbi:arylsulfatase B-like [Chrysoperla carnea]|uniref:arylsulfatase B-like n=1 Tax=Chrysoperla carnea TaxID=189513 RepID=UPI001D07C49D|nr:arylsulfatase B-like [Chrysoperla carnea]